MALITPIAGPFTATYAPPSVTAATLGIVEDPGYRIRFTPQWELINDTDAYAAQAADSVFLGFSLVALDFICKEAGKLMPYRAVNPGSTFVPSGITTFAPGQVGRLGSALAGATILTAVAGTPAAATPATATFTLCQIREGFDVELVFGPKHRKVPVGFRILAYDSGAGVPAYWSAT